MLNSSNNKQIIFIRGRFKSQVFTVQKWSLVTLPLELQSADQKQGNFVFNSDNTISVPKAGFYRISATYCILDYAHVQGLIITRYNSDLSVSEHMGGELHSPSGNYNFGHCETITNMQLGDKIGFNVYADADGTMAIPSGPDRQGSFIIEYIGGGD